ncbi:dTMP kinase [Candidatus Neomarinimicrobiota bacterium]
MGKLIVFEGIDGSGKSTQIDILKHTLEKAGKDVIALREPGGTKLSEQIRTILLSKGSTGIGDVAELFLFCAARAQLVEELIKPALDENKIVLCDRFMHSTVAYQGYGRELPVDEIIATQSLVTDDIRPDLVILLDLPVKVGYDRLNTGEIDRMEDAGDDFMERVRNGYLKLAQKDSQNWLVLDGTSDQHQIAEEIETRVKSII